MFEKLANIFRVPDLRKRVLFTLAMLAVYRLGSHIPTPGINTDQLQKAFEQQSGGLLGFYDLFSGGNLRRLTIFALGIMPYITACVILQLLTVVLEPPARSQNHPVDALSDADSFHPAKHGNSLYIAGPEVRREPGTGVHPDDDYHPDHRQYFHYVAGRADYRTRRGQRHVFADLCRHRGWLAESRGGPGAKSAVVSLGQ